MPHQTHRLRRNEKDAEKSISNVATGLLFFSPPWGFSSGLWYCQEASWSSCLVVSWHNKFFFLKHRPYLALFRKGNAISCLSAPWIGRLSYLYKGSKCETNAGCFHKTFICPTKIHMERFHRNRVILGNTDTKGYSEVK